MDSPDKWKIASYEADCTGRGDSIHGAQGMPSSEAFEGMVASIVQADDDQNGESGYPFSSKTRKVLGEQQNYSSPVTRTDCKGGGRNADVIVLLCRSGAFTEAEAMGLFAKSIEGIYFIGTKQYADKIRTYLHFARVLVLSKSIKQRFERAKSKYEKENEHLMDDNTMEETELNFKEILNQNNINAKEFFEDTFRHFMRQSNKKNNLFFLRPPSTGKR